MPTRGLVCIAILSLAIAPCRAAMQARTNEDVTVLLFHTEDVTHVHVRSDAASMKLCGTCAGRRGPFDLDLQLRGTLLVDAAGRQVGPVAIEGEARVQTEGGHHAAAAGRWLIRSVGDQIRVSVTIPRERYVAAVLAAESDPHAPAEALKALAVVARSFAMGSVGKHTGGDFCDTTHCQALRLEPIAKPFREAVWSTSGETLWAGGKQVPAYFSQHCGGYTEDAALAWGGAPLSSLPARADGWCARVPSQWRASLTRADVRQALVAEGYPLTGSIHDVLLLERDRSGRVQKVELRSTNGTRVLPAATFRFAINRRLGWNQLRSDRYQVRSVGDRFLFEGSGLGHGVGMCQAGSTEMAHAGKKYREVLQTYFPGATVRVQADDAGWITSIAEGFTMRSVAREPLLLPEAIHSFAEARSRWGLPVSVRADVTIFPSTSLFREATGRPGWELAVTQGSQIATQPIALLRAHEHIGPVLRHEFLHSFAEAEASPHAPLWIREGIVEVLNGEACNSRMLLSPDAVNAALRQATSRAQSQQAHAAACELARRLIDTQGLSAAHAMLQHP